MRSAERQPLPMSAVFGTAEEDEDGPSNGRVTPTAMSLQRPGHGLHLVTETTSS